VETPGLCDGQRLRNPTDVRTGFRREQQVEVVAHPPETLERKGVALLSLRQGFQESRKVAAAGEHRLPIVAAVECVVDEAVSEQPRKSCLAGGLTATSRLCKRKIELTGFLRFLVVTSGKMNGHYFPDTISQKQLVMSPIQGRFPKNI
jgi:hypothetical protein